MARYLPQLDRGQIIPMQHNGCSLIGVEQAARKPDGKSRHLIAIIRCHCGNVGRPRLTKFRSGTVKSCGCLSRRRAQYGIEAATAAILKFDIEKQVSIAEEVEESGIASYRRIAGKYGVLLDRWTRYALQKVRAKWRQAVFDRLGRFEFAKRYVAHGGKDRPLCTQISSAKTHLGTSRVSVHPRTGYLVWQLVVMHAVPCIDADEDQLLRTCWRAAGTLTGVIMS